MNAPLNRFVSVGVVLVAALLATSSTPLSSHLPPPAPAWAATATPTPLLATSPSTSTPAPNPAPAPAPTPFTTPTLVHLPDSAEVPILMYHYVDEPPPEADRLRRDLTVRPETFEAQLQYLSDSGYDTIYLADLYLHLTQGQPLPEKPIILTFDDGYRDAYTVVFPLLQEYGFVGTFFVLATPAHYESPDYLTWAMMEEMAQAGMEIEGHGRDHVDLRGRSYDYLVYQILGIREAVEGNIGQPVRFFCYPSGRYDEGVLTVLRSAWYWGAVSTEYGRVHTLEDLFTLHRVRIRGTDSLETFIAKVEGHY